MLHRMPSRIRQIIFRPLGSMNWDPLRTRMGWQKAVRDMSFQYLLCCRMQPKCWCQQLTGECLLHLILSFSLVCFVLMIYICFVVLCRAFWRTTGTFPVPVKMLETQFQHPPPHRRRTVSVESIERKLFFPSQKRSGGESRMVRVYAYDVMLVLFSFFGFQVSGTNPISIVWCNLLFRCTTNLYGLLSCLCPAGTYRGWCGCRRVGRLQWIGRSSSRAGNWD